MTHRVLGIDPGYDRCGVALVERADNGTETLLYSSCITPPPGSAADRLSALGQAIQTLLTTYTPDAVSIEKLFFSKNQKTALKVAEARGVLLAAASSTQTPVYEYSPQEIKLALTGYGASSKDQVAHMVKRLVRVRENVEHDDEFDAIATALTHTATKKRLG